MADSIFISFLLASVLLISWSGIIHGESNEEQGFISVDISNKGLNFAKNILVETAESSLVPLELPDIKKSVDIPVVGKVEMTLSNVVINTIDVVSSTIKTGDSGILIAVSGATANLTMNWRYSYKTWLFPVISDQGKASVQVEGMDMGLTLSLQNQQGSLALSLLDCGCFVEDISINLDGGASWLYQGFGTIKSPSYC
nr:putative BPI/LBP family protein At1g04970 [Ipomoea batatas]